MANVKYQSLRGNSNTPFGMEKGWTNKPQVSGFESGSQGYSSPLSNHTPLRGNKYKKSHKLIYEYSERQFETPVKVEKKYQKKSSQRSQRSSSEAKTYNNMSMNSLCRQQPTTGESMTNREHPLSANCLRKCGFWKV